MKPLTRITRDPAVMGGKSVVDSLVRDVKARQAYRESA